MTTQRKIDLIAKIDELIEASRADLAADTIKLVDIKSVMGVPLPGAPFGEGPKQVLDYVLDLGQKEGFYTVDYHVGVVSIAMKDGNPDLGIWLHGDVVPEDDGWNFEPYKAVEYKGCIIGRGATDNKGQLAAIFHLFKIFKTLNIELKYNPAIYVGSNEESGMKDIVDFLHKYTPPRFSLVPDSGFPVGYGGRGSVKLTLRTKTPLYGSTSDLQGSMPAKISQALLEEKLVDERDQYILDFLRSVSFDTAGSMFHINVNSESMKRSLTVSVRKINIVCGHVEVLLDIRYPIEITDKTIIERVAAVCEQNGFLIRVENSSTRPYMLDPESNMIKRLTQIANDVTGDVAEPYILGGSTYAHFLPNALVYGTDGNLPPEDFPKDRGRAHGVDEAVSLDRLQRAMKIYARALLELNDIDWLM